MKTQSHPFQSWISLMFLVCCAATGTAQQSVNALFVGNSYTAVNNLPHMVEQIAASMGDQLTWQSNTPGGCNFSQHCSNRSMELICNGGWDIVVLQEQSQYPSFPQEQVEAEVFPYAKRLVDSIYAHSPCCEPMFYMTWGRKYGDAVNAPYFPVLGTYEGMDSMLCERYTFMAHQYDASLCPVGRVWNYLRRNHSDIELYQSDGSHPSVAGTYAAACAFYTLFFHRDPDSITFSASLPEPTAQTLRSAVRQVVFDDLSRWQRPEPQATLEVSTITDHTFTFSATTLRADSLTWDFGDGTDTTTAANATVLVHTYTDTGDYSVCLTASRHCMTATSITSIHIASNSDTNGIVAIPERGEIKVYPNPAHDKITVMLPADLHPIAVSIFSIDGRQVDRQSSTELTLSHLPSGEYLLAVECAEGTLTHRIIKR